MTNNKTPGHPPLTQYAARKQIMLRSVVIVMVGVLVSGCIPTSTHPITPLSVSPVDMRILGTWIWRDENETGYLHIGLGEKTNQLNIVQVTETSKGALKDDEFTGHVSSIGSGTYLNIIWPKETGQNKYIFAKYTFGKGGELRISLMGTSAVKKAIQSGSLKGTIKKQKWVDDVHVSSDGPELERYINENHEKIFDDYIEMHRINNTAA